jgi:hypothetical protein
MFFIPLIRFQQTCPMPTPILFPTSLFTLLNQHAPASDFPAFPLEQQPFDRPLRIDMFRVISGQRLD